MTFQELKIDPRCLRTLEAKNITVPTPVQAQAIPPAMEGRDVVAIAQTGTGKTFAFGLPALTNLANAPRNGTKMLVLAPTRELAQQVHSVLAPLAKAVKLSTACIYGGVSMNPQTMALRQGVSIVVATPGRLLDHINRGNARFHNLSMLVLDEADRMLDMGFLPDIRRIIAECPDERQTMMFSATFPDEIARLTKSMQRDPVRIELAMATPSEAVRQVLYTVAKEQKIQLLTKILEHDAVTSTVVFVRTKHQTDRIAKALIQRGFKADAIHGGHTQGRRQRAIDGFRRGKHDILVATDVAARGLDVKGITHVINYDIPGTSDDYIHRIGRTARASADGDAITFVSHGEGKELGAIERAIGRPIDRVEWEGQIAIGTTAPRVRTFAPSGSRFGRGGGRRRAATTSGRRY